jgi:hypothetical protein
MDTLDYIPEIADCISRSSCSLKALKLSFSENLALKARKKTVTETSDTETVQEDDEVFGNDTLLPPPPPPPVIFEPPIFPTTSTSASNDATVRGERLAQEKAFARIFGLDKETPVQKRLEQIAEDAIACADREAQAAVRASSRDDIDRLFVKELHSIMRDLSQKKSVYASTSKGLKTIEKIEKAAAKYLERNENSDSFQKEKKKAFPSHKKIPYKNPVPPPKPPPFFSQNMQPSKTDLPYDDLFTPFEIQNGPYSPGPVKKGPLTYSQKHKGYYVPNPSFISQGPMPLTPVVPQIHQSKVVPNWKGTSMSALNPSSSTSETGDAVPDDGSGSDHHTPGSSFKTNNPKTDENFLDVVDIEHPDEDSEEGEDQEFLDPADSSPESEDQCSISGPTLIQNGINGNILYEEAQPSSSRKGKEPMRGSETINHTPAAGSSDRKIVEDDEASSEKAIHDYVRLHHGIPLESLSIYLIPVKPSVLCRAVNICALRHLSLLNVGPQRAFWAMVAKLHKTMPLQLTSIHTDNVTPSFLAFLNGLSYLKELFIIERSSRSKVEPLAPKTVVVIDDIRRLVLAKHIRHLKRLMIRNDDDSSWALNKESVRLITKYGAMLKELVITLGSSNFVSYFRFSFSDSTL